MIRGLTRGRSGVQRHVRRLGGPNVRCQLEDLGGSTMLIYDHPPAATLDLLSDGRFELGLGAAWSKREYEQAGYTFDSPAMRVERLGEADQILRALWSGEPVAFHRAGSTRAFRSSPQPAATSKAQHGKGIAACCAGNAATQGLRRGLVVASRGWFRAGRPARVGRYGMRIWQKRIGSTPIAQFRIRRRSRRMPSWPWPAIEANRGRFIIRGNPSKTYEAGLMQRVVVIEFDSVEQALEAHDSAAYQAALKALDTGADRDIRIVEGIA